MGVSNNLALYVNQFIKLILEKNNEVPYVYGNIIAYLRYDENLKMYMLNHPYQEKIGKCESGEAAFSPEDVKFIRMANEAEKILWAKEYKQFHNDWVKAKGYDYCELDFIANKLLDDVEITMK